jgi:hypothetical protein
VNRQKVIKQTGASISGGPRVLSEIRQLIDSAPGRVAVVANLSMVNLYWNIGRIITEDIQKNPERASYGEQLIEELGRRLTTDYGRGFSARNLWDMKRFSAESQILQAPPAESPGRAEAPGTSGPGSTATVPARRRGLEQLSGRRTGCCATYPLRVAPIWKRSRSRERKASTRRISSRPSSLGQNTGVSGKCTYHLDTWAVLARNRQTLRLATSRY